MPRTRRRKTKTLNDFTDDPPMQGAGWHQAHETAIFYVEDKALDKQIYAGELLTKFYNINEEQNPLYFQLQEDLSQAIPEKVWWVVMRGNFFIDIEKGSETEGPHRTRLWFKTFSRPIQNHWIASLQLEAFYFNEEQMKAALLKAIAEREFYMSPSDRDKAITP